MDGTEVFLEPTAAYQAAQKMGESDPLGVSSQTLRKRLHEHGLLASTGRGAEGRNTLLVRRTLEGRRRDVLHLHANALWEVPPIPEDDHNDQFLSTTGGPRGVDP